MSMTQRATEAHSPSGSTMTTGATIVERALTGASAGAVVGAVGGLGTAIAGAIVGAIANNGGTILSVITRHHG
jgi:hypothetical protein